MMKQIESELAHIDLHIEPIIVFNFLSITEMVICDMIKGNESDVANIVFKILAKKDFKFLCFILFIALLNGS